MSKKRQLLVIDPADLKTSKNYHDRNEFNFKLKPIESICVCHLEKEKKYRQHVLDLSRRIFATTASTLDFGDVEIIHLIKKYGSIFTFTTPPKNAFITDSQYCITVKLKNNDNVQDLQFLITFSSRLDFYCRNYPNSEIDLQKLVNTSAFVYCWLCHQQEHIEWPMAGMFKSNGQIKWTVVFMVLKERRKPFIDASGNLTWFTSNQKIVETNYKEILDSTKAEMFGKLVEIKHLFGEGIGNNSFMTMSTALTKMLGNVLCVVYGNKVTGGTVFQFKNNRNKYEHNRRIGNLDSAFGNVKFETPTDGSLERGHENINRVAAQTKSKGDGFHKDRTYYQPANFDLKIFEVMKMVSYMSKVTKFREINSEDVGLIAIPDTTDSNKVGLSARLVPGVKFSNRMTCRPNILQLFSRQHVADDRGVSVTLVGSNLEHEVIHGSTIQSIVTTIEHFADAGIYFDIHIDMERKIGYILSFHGLIIYDKPNMTVTTKNWIEKYSTLKDVYFNRLSFIGCNIPFIQHDNNPKIVGYMRSRTQEVDRPVPPFVTHMYSQSQVTTLNYPQKALNNKYDFGSGQNVIVAIGCYQGQNVEESILVNKYSADLGLFQVTKRRTLPFLVQKTSTSNISVHQFKKGALLTNDCVVFEILGICTYRQYSREIYVKRRENGFIFYYKDVLFKNRWFIDDIEIRNFDSENTHILLVLKSICPCEEGVKLSTSHAQKGIVTQLVPKEDMPFDKNGIVPDLFINIQYYNRMTMGQEMEGSVGRYIAEHGYLDFLNCGEENLKNPKEFISDIKETMTYSGITGEPLGKTVWGIVSYKRYRQEGDRDIQCGTIASQGEKRDICTGQFQKGKANGGGMSLGVMEIVNLHVIGSKELMYQLNDKASGSFNNKNHPDIGRLNATGVSINDTFIPNGFVYDYK